MALAKSKGSTGAHSRAGAGIVARAALLSAALAGSGAAAGAGAAGEAALDHRSERTLHALTPPELARSEPSLERLGSREEPVFAVSNPYYGPLEIEVSLQQGRNVRTRPSLPRRFVVAGHGVQRLFDVRARNPRAPWAYSFKYRTVPGDPKARHRPPGPYRLPFPPGRRYRVDQAFGGESTHDMRGSFYAVDIALPEGTPVLAARAGVVMAVERDGTVLAPDGSNDARANYVRVLHADGTMAVYAHLQEDGVLAQPGQRVAPGDPLGLSGETGLATGPHLHFVIQRNAGMELVSVPHRFADGDGKPVRPEAGMYLGHVD